MSVWGLRDTRGWVYQMAAAGETRYQEVRFSCCEDAEQFLTNPTTLRPPGFHDLRPVELRPDPDKQFLDLLAPERDADRVYHGAC